MEDALIYLFVIVFSLCFFVIAVAFIISLCMRMDTLEDRYIQATDTMFRRFADGPIDRDLPDTRFVKVDYSAARDAQQRSRRNAAPRNTYFYSQDKPLPMGGNRRLTFV